jgi:hypothetical protein
MTLLSERRRRQGQPVIFPLDGSATLEVSKILRAILTKLRFFNP